MFEKFEMDHIKERLRETEDKVRNSYQYPTDVLQYNGEKRETTLKR